MVARALEVGLEQGVVCVLREMLELEQVVSVLLEVPLMQRRPVTQAGHLALGRFADNLHDADGAGA